MKDRTINEAMWDALHILSSAYAPATRSERVALEILAETAQRVADTFVRVRARPLTPAEIQALERVVHAALTTAAPLPDTPPGGIRKV